MNAKGKSDCINITIGLVVVASIFAYLKPHITGYETITIQAKEPVVLSITATPTPPPARQSENKGGLDDYEIKKMVHETFGEKDGRIAYAIAKAESHLKPDKCHIDEREYSCGLFQINLRAHFNKIPGNTFEEKAEFLKVPKNNVMIAKFLFGGSEWFPWSA